MSKQDEQKDEAKKEGGEGRAECNQNQQGLASLQSEVVKYHWWVLGSIEVKVGKTV